jgi:hypothetical protein
MSAWQQYIADLYQAMTHKGFLILLGCSELRTARLIQQAGHSFYVVMNLS